MNKKVNTSWGKEAEWYDEVVKNDDSYQQQVILPNLLRLMEIKMGEQILDVGCGTGFFSKEFVKAGGQVIGIDVGRELIAIAKKNVPTGKFLVASAEEMSEIASDSMNKAVIVLALQNIVDASAAIKECDRVLKKDAQLFIVLNHPAFRVPQASSWGWDEKEKVQYRRLDSYLSEKKVKIQMHPGENSNEVTWSFHRPLQYFFKLFNKNKLVVTRLEEWTSHRTTGGGPRKEAEDKARAEFPLFVVLCLKKA